MCFFHIFFSFSRLVPLLLLLLLMAQRAFLFLLRRISSYGFCLRERKNERKKAKKYSCRWRRWKTSKPISFCREYVDASGEQMWCARVRLCTRWTRSLFSTFKVRTRFRWSVQIANAKNENRKLENEILRKSLDRLFTILVSAAIIMGRIRTGSESRMTPGLRERKELISHRWKLLYYSQYECIVYFYCLRAQPLTSTQHPAHTHRK